jgi:hypothetical protein
MKARVTKRERGDVEAGLVALARPRTRFEPAHEHGTE